MNKWSAFTIPLTALLSILSFFAYLQLFPVEWGSLTYEPAQTVTVYGSSQQQKTNEIASFTAGVSQMDEDKQVAIDAVNSQVSDIITQVKSFGVADDDIQTQSISIHQIDNEFERPQLETTQWRANNSIEITLRDATKASAMAELLAGTGATNVYGPNFRLDNTQNPQDTLLQDAIANAREKAEEIAAGSDARLGKILQVDETMSNSTFAPAVMMAEGRGGGAPTEPGSTTISKTVKVVFALR